MRSTIQITGSNIAITRIGFGCARLFGGIEARSSRRLVEAALSVGIRHFDTAPSYGHSESVLGDVLAGVPNVTIATKVGIAYMTGKTRSPVQIVYRKLARPILSFVPGIKSKLLRTLDRRDKSSNAAESFAMRRELSRDFVLRSLEESLKRLKRSRIDIFLIHEPDQFELDDKLLALFSTLQGDGIINTFGLAYGRVVATAPELGTIIQSRYSPEILHNTETRRVRILHGTLRFGWNSMATSRCDETTSEYLGTILHGHPNLAVVFSASSRHQIRDTVGKLLR